MSRHVDPALRWAAGTCLGALAAMLPVAHGQTIGDYSRAQRALLESTMAQAAARAAGQPGAASAPATPVAAGAVPAPPARLRPAAGMPSPTVRVSGVFTSLASAVAEVVVDGAPYLLVAGQGVPGTAWRVESVAADQVVLDRRDAVRGAVRSEAARRVFALPELR